MNTDEFCYTIAPYVIFIMIFVLVTFIIWTLAVHGANVTGTEANIYYNHLGDAI